MVLFSVKHGVDSEGALSRFIFYDAGSISLASERTEWGPEEGARDAFSIKSRKRPAQADRRAREPPCLWMASPTVFPGPFDDFSDSGQVICI